MITDLKQKRFCKGTSSFVLVLLAVIILLVGIANYSILVWSQARIIEHEATRVAEVVTSHALSARSVYSTQLSEVPMHFSELPIPSEFLKLVARDVSANNMASYSYTPLSLWNLDSNQAYLMIFSIGLGNSLKHKIRITLQRLSIGSQSSALSELMVLKPCVTWWLMARIQKAV
ncbi:hypothetical protein [Nitrincola nitratireducens]|uniref:Uncharacterized protein n=1 Tax=Nitrincola nitratireducens TaxID=1229521 RepID=W9VJM9_9GAMM|nr:hypothetical protein [Nitrincola nitratireducens]EXJ10775.1 hypothetical protein D791_02382 [Nitrincola nitratireducens]